MKLLISALASYNAKIIPLKAHNIKCFVDGASNLLSQWHFFVKGELSKLLLTRKCFVSL